MGSARHDADEIAALQIPSGFSRSRRRGEIGDLTAARRRTPPHAAARRRTPPHADARRRRLRAAVK
jgi:hypothetical protein